MVEVNIGQAIKKGLERKGWPQKKLAQSMEISTPMVCKWLKNRAIPTGDALIKLALILDIVPDLFPGYSKSEKASSEISPLIQKQLDELRNEIDQIKQKLS